MHALFYPCCCTLLLFLAMISGKIVAQEQPTRLNVPAPELADVTAWINSEPLTFAKLKGKVVVVHFYAFG
jgi:hypothetical protein